MVIPGKIGAKMNRSNNSKAPPPANRYLLYVAAGSALVYFALRLIGQIRTASGSERVIICIAAAVFLAAAAVSFKRIWVMYREQREEKDPDAGHPGAGTGTNAVPDPKQENVSLTTPHEDCTEELSSSFAFLVADNRAVVKKLRKNSYDKSFDRFLAHCRELCDKLPAGRRRPDMFGHIVSGMLDLLERDWKKREPSFDDQLLVSLYLVPALQKADPEMGAVLADTLHQQWVRRYPKSPFNVGTYEEISSGFKKRFRLL